MKSNFVTRTIKDGRVKIYGRIYRPDNCYMTYDGRLDGMRYMFGLYYRSDGELEDFVYLGCMEGSRTFGPECVEGHFPWMWWRIKPRGQVAQSEEKKGA